MSKQTNVRDWIEEYCAGYSEDTNYFGLLNLMFMELRPPINTAQGYAALLKHDLKAPNRTDEIKSYPEKIIASLEKLSELIDACKDCAERLDESK